MGSTTVAVFPTKSSDDSALLEASFFPTKIFLNVFRNKKTDSTENTENKNHCTLGEGASSHVINATANAAIPKNNEISPGAATSNSNSATPKKTQFNMLITKTPFF